MWKMFVMFEVVSGSWLYLVYNSNSLLRKCHLKQDCSAINESHSKGAEKTVDEFHKLCYIKVNTPFLIITFTILQ